MFTSIVAILAACTPEPQSPGPDPIPTTPIAPPVTATGPVDLVDVVARPHEVYGSILTVTWTQSREATVHLEFSIDEGQWRTSPEREVDAGEHEELILGAPYGHEVTWRLVGATPEGSTTTPDVSSATGALPASVPSPELREADLERVDPDVGYVLVAVSYDDDLGGEGVATLIDRRGRVVWAQPAERGMALLHPRVAWHDTSFLIDHSGFWGSIPGLLDNSVVVEMKIDGTEVRRVEAPGLYHAFTDMPDGTIAYPRHWSTNWDDDPGPDGEVVVLLHPDGTQTDLFDCDAWLRNRPERPDVCGANTLSYDAATDRFLYSLFTVDTVLELDASTGVATRWFGHLPDAYTFDPPDSAFWYQHGPVYLDDGRLLVSTHRAEDTTDLVVREYEVDESAGTLRETASYGVAPEEPGRQMGEAHRLPGGNTLHNYGTHALLREFAPDGAVVWDVRWEDEEYTWVGHQIGRSAPVAGDLYRFASPRR